MKYLKSYILFNEDFIISPTDGVNVSNAKNRHNQIKSFIDEFNSKKTVIENIYQNYKDRNDLINKLKSQKFLLDGSTPESLKFENPLISIWADISHYKRKITEIEDSIEINNDDIKLKNDQIKLKPNISDVLKQSIEDIQKRIVDKKNKINEYRNQISQKEKDSQEKIKQLSDELKNLEDRINKDEK
jgi:chromosome segregation ATPase